MAISTATGYLDLSLGYIVPTNNGTWTNLSGTTWDNWNSWIASPVSPLVWVTNPQDAGSINFWNIKIESTYQGNLQKFEIYASTTGAFTGEETTYTINNGDNNIQAFYGRYFRVAAFVYNTGAELALYNLSITTTDYKLELTFNDVDSSSLPTWVSISSTATVADARVLDIGRPVSAVVDAHFTPHFISTGTNGYAVPGDNYQYFEQFNWGPVTHASIVKKHIITTATSIASGVGTAFILQNQNGDFIDNTVDVRLRCLPEQYMIDGQLLTR